MNNSLVKANDITNAQNAKSVSTLTSGGEDVAELKRLFTGDNGDQLFVKTGDYVTWKGITLRTGEGPGNYASQWTHSIKSYAADELGEQDNPNIVRKSYDGDTIWNVDWLETHFPAIRKLEAAVNTKPKVYY